MSDHGNIIGPRSCRQGLAQLHSGLFLVLNDSVPLEDAGFGVIVQNQDRIAHRPRGQLGVNLLRSTGQGIGRDVDRVQGHAKRACADGPAFGPHINQVLFSRDELGVHVAIIILIAVNVLFSADHLVDVLVIQGDFIAACDRRDKPRCQLFYHVAKFHAVCRELNHFQLSQRKNCCKI